MKRNVFRKEKNNISNSLYNTVEAQVFQNKNNKQLSLSVLKKNTSPEVIKNIENILNDKNAVGLKFKITDVIRKNDIKLLKGGKI